jgi:hypothetical protein
MAKGDKSNETNTEATAATSGNDERYKVVKVDGKTWKRADYIRHCWVDRKMSRGAIAKHLTELNSTDNGGDGKKIPYQTVFAVIKKGTPGGPDKPAESAAA